MRNREYMFTNKSYARGGIVSTIMGFLACIFLIWGVILSFQKKGMGGSFVGLLGAGALILSVAGAIIGIRSFKEEDKFYTFSRLGSFVCCIVSIIMILITIWGVVL